MVAPKLRFKEFDQKWGVDALQDQIDFLAGYAFDSKLMSNEPQKYQLIKMSNVYQNQLDLTRNPSYWTNIDSKIEKFLLKKGDIVLTLTGTVGKTDYGYNVEIDKDDKFLLNQRLVRLRAKQDLSDSKFIQYRISTDKFFYHFFYSSKGGTGNQSNVSIEDLKLLELNFPSKEEQTKIASFLSAVDEKISQLTQKHQLLSQYKQGMMQKLFSQQLRFKADDGSEFGEWENTVLGDIADIVGGGTPSTNNEEYWSGDVVWLTPSEINQKFIGESKRTISELGVQKSSAKKLPIGTILFTSRATIGEVAIAIAEVTTNQGFQSFISNEITFNEFLYYWIVNNKKSFIERASGSTFLEISKSKIQPMEISLPCLEEQTKIANFLSAIDQKIEVVAQQIEQAKIWKKGLLQQMFM